MGIGGVSVISTFLGQSSSSRDQSSGDVPFGFPMAASGGGGGAAFEEQQRLIQTGQLTPFGTSIDSRVDPSSSSLPAQPNASPAQDKLELPEKLDSAESGLLAGSCDAGSTRGLRTARIPKRTASSREEPALENVESKPSVSHSEAPEPSMDLEESSWLPSLEDLLDDGESSSQLSSESEYFTDEELGEVKRKKKKRLRELSSDGLSDEDELQPKRKKRKRRADHSRYHDDGDEELYRLRIQ